MGYRRSPRPVPLEVRRRWRLPMRKRTGLLTGPASKRDESRTYEERAEAWTG